jgi:pyruvate dehydrogenase E2 component (dihydrolipoamide acetyltransferase)
LAGKHATPIVVPPAVAILGSGVCYDAVVAENGKPAVHRLLPLSLTFDHRAATGGEASRFLGAVIQALGQ